MELSDLRVFKSVVEEGGVTKAAEKLNRVPSNVTSRIQKLENELGKSLFIRDKKRMQISASGRLLLEYADQILSLANKAIAEFGDNEPKGRLKIGAMEAVAAARLSEPLMGFHNQFPHVDINLTTGPSGVLIEEVLAGRVDLALVADPLRDERLVSKPVFKETLVAVTGLDIPDITNPSDFAPEMPVLAFSLRCAYRKRLLDWIAEAGVTSRILEINSYHNLMACAVAGMGVGVVPVSVIEAHPMIKGLKAHPLPGSFADSTTHAIWRKQGETPAIGEFYQALIEANSVK
ncbi:hypothetical protein A9Q99_01105 [Gammaproteobacteria bacterium 45_16_T64]|nr:hypothetical protein A9Q99_01105 [Gammaproteobacteria bacterium 45_16_T64]